MTVTTVLFDLDGVVRHFDPATAGPWAAAEWRHQPFIVDDAVLEVTQELRVGGVHVSVLSNATDGLHDELVGTRVLDAFERIFNSAEIGRSSTTGWPTSRPPVGWGCWATTIRVVVPTLLSGCAEPCGRPVSSTPAGA